MSVENAIRERHAFRDRLREFLDIPMAMTDDEIELGLGRLVDLLGQTDDRDEQLNLRLKGNALKIYFDLRGVGEASQVIAKRNELAKRAVFIDDCLLNEIAEFQLVPKGTTEPDVTVGEVKRLTKAEA